jgi:hypothetical protein
VRMMPPRWEGGPRPAVASGAVPGDCVVITVAVCQARHDHKHVMTEMQVGRLRAGEVLLSWRRWAVVGDARVKRGVGAAAAWCSGASGE